MSDNSVHNTVRDLMEKGTQAKSDGQHIEALKKFDEAQNIIKINYGESAPELANIYSEIAILCNILSMAHLQKEDYKICQELLKKAEVFTEGNPRLKAITFNNYACFFRKTNKLRNALSYLEQALDLEYTSLNKSQDQVDQSLKLSNPCEIHLNICAILSQIGKHELALHHAMKALILIQDELICRTSENNDKIDDRLTVMVIALHNIAVEQEFLSMFNQALNYYKKSRDFAEKSLGLEHLMTKKMDQVYQQASEKIKEIMEKRQKKKASSLFDFSNLIEVEPSHQTKNFISPRFDKQNRSPGRQSSQVSNPYLKK